MKIINRHWLCAMTLSVTPFMIPLLVPQSAVAQTPVTEGNSAKSASWIELKVHTDQTQYTAGEPIKVTLKATNIQSKDAYLKFSSGQRFDLQLFQPDKKEPIYIWSANKMFATMLSHVKLKQGESETYDAEIGDQMGVLKPGNYLLRAHLANSSQIGAQSVAFTVLARTASYQQNATLTATTGKRIYAVGEAVNVEFTLQNNLRTSTTFDFRSGQTYDVFIRNQAGKLVWSWAANKRFLMVARPVTLTAGEKQKFSVEWEGQPLPDFHVTPGKYTVQAVYASTPNVNAPPISIEIRRVKK